MHNSKNIVTSLEQFSLDDAFLNWFGGLFDGEGSFSFSLCYLERMLLRYQIKPQINLSLVDIESDLLPKVANTLKMGFVIRLHRKFSPQIRRSPQLCWRIASVAEAGKFTVLILPYLRLKQQIGKEFLRILDQLNSGKQDTIEGFLEICESRDKLNNRPKPINYKDVNWFRLFFEKHPVSKERIAYAKCFRHRKVKPLFLDII